MGLNFSTTTIINKNQDPDSKNAALFEVLDVNGVKTLRIKRDFVFEADKIKVIRKRAGYDAVPCKATVNFEEILDLVKSADENVYCRLDVYVKYEGQEPFYGANPMHVQKGIPFWVEFTVKPSDSAAVLAERVAKLIKKDHLFLIDKDIINVTVNGAELELEGATEYMRFDKIQVSKFGLSDEYADVVASIEDELGVKLTERGYNSFGTYSQIVKDLRLPTAANYQWTHIRQAETPIVGAIYDQYIIEYCAPASNEGTMFVGHRGESWTTHVFWVNSGDAELQADWVAAIEGLGVEVKTVCCDGAFKEVETSQEETITEETTEAGE